MMRPPQTTGSPRRLCADDPPDAIVCASSTAPRAFRNPAPSVSALYSVLVSAVYSRTALTRFGVSVGFACSIRAMVPVTTGAAMLVPLNDRYGSVAVGNVPHRRAAGFD